MSPLDDALCRGDLDLYLRGDCSEFLFPFKFLCLSKDLDLDRLLLSNDLDLLLLSGELDLERESLCLSYDLDLERLFLSNDLDLDLFFLVFLPWLWSLDLDLFLRYELSSESVEDSVPVEGLLLLRRTSGLELCLPMLWLSIT
jgi:hypothetical protein